MKQQFINPSRIKDWIQAGVFAALFLMTGITQAQEASQGNTTIFAGAQATFFGNHDFATGGGPVQAGIVGTERTTSTIGTGFGVLGYADGATTTSGADDNNHVDGYVRKYSSTAVKFVFPVGDNKTYRPFAANPANLVTGAYFRADPGVAVTSNLAGGNYGPLPGGLTFPTTNMGPSIAAVLNKGYWDIDGTTGSKLTLSWDNVVVDDISALTGGSLNKLTIVGWNPTTNRWERIASTLDVTSLYGTASTLTQGSITSNSNVIPSNFTVYTLAAATPDLQPNITVLPSVVGGITPINIKIDVIELNNVPTNGSTITLNMLVFPDWTIGVTPGTVINGWTYVGIVGPNHRFTSTEIIQNSASTLNIPATFDPHGKVGTFTFNIGILSNSGGEKPNTNNTDQETLSFEP